MVYHASSTTSEFGSLFRVPKITKPPLRPHTRANFMPLREHNRFLRKPMVLPRCKDFRSVLRNQMHYAALSPGAQKPTKPFPGIHQQPLREPTHTSPANTVRHAQHQCTEYVIKPGDTLWALAVKKFHVHVHDLMNDNNIKDPRTLQPGTKIKIRKPAYPKEQEVVASWYGGSFHGKAMANGEIYNMYAATIAHKDLPLGTRVQLENLATGTKVDAVVTDRGPFVKGRDVDLSYGLARKLSLVEKGVDKLVMRIKG